MEIDGDDDYGTEHYDKRVVKYHVEDEDRPCFGTVTNSGFRKNVMHWTITFDEEDAAVYDNNERGQLEDLDYNELMDAFELYEELKEDDPKKP